ncbi:NAD(P)/FAD-dependent oxidoreductase [Paenarthrobacter sp. AB444]|uniref:NAD(P)/FAD-dependent oxidoreductase n=1 Tax=Paenarthrobacter sp. AB444 TaxID=3025681 RepID=UPI00236700C7|nr:FAD-dependent oxidoreductase [Paenarthrobacter sp. AB444]MDD7833912.1 FAD-dependent oxidoreductase [Paenarthrobacter sp. AB444]
MLEIDQDVLIVGASAAGLCTAEALRREGHRGRLTLMDAEPLHPYDRPPLSKQLLAGTWDASRVYLRTEAELEALGAEWALDEQAVHLETSARSVRTATGRLFSADAVVLATGLVPRRLGGFEDVRGLHVLRSLNDALALHARLQGGGVRLVVVGNGVMGSEVAATAAGMGVEVTLVGRSSLPMASQLGDFGSSLLAAKHVAAGVRLIGAQGVQDITVCEGEVRGVVLLSGEFLPADDVVVAIGSRPNIDWLAHSGLNRENGIGCDARCRAAPGIWAVGDVARWHHPRLGDIRLENRTNAAEQAIAVASDILGAGQPYAPVPYFWSDQYGVKIQVHGSIPAGARMTITDGEPNTDRFVAVADSSEGAHPTGVLGWNMPKQTRLRRMELEEVLAPAFP